jgi:2-phospho-L-lactate guanylyltransferase
MSMPDGAERVVAVVPVRGLEGAKSRLGGVLDPEERRDLVSKLLQRVVEAAAAATGIAEVVVVSPDPAALELAGQAGARPLLQRGAGLNDALVEARADVLGTGPADLLVLPADLPEVDPAGLAAMVRAVDRRPCVVLAPDRHGRGTNALLLAPAGIVDFAFGGDSRSAHARAARAVGAAYREVDAGLSLDLDTPDDLLLHEARTADRATASRHPDAAPRSLEADPRSDPGAPAGGRATGGPR